MIRLGLVMKSKYARRSKISEGKVRELVRYFAADLTAPPGSDAERSKPQHRESVLPWLAGTHSA